MPTYSAKVAKFDPVKCVAISSKANISADIMLPEFFRIHLRSILKLYAVNERQFDPTGMHSRPHIIRSLLLSEIMMNFYTLHCGVDFHKINCYIPVAFHSLGRQGNGEDLWKTESAMFCKSYLINKGFLLRESEQMASYVSNLTILDEYHQIVRDIEIFEILRMIDPTDFDELRLSFLSDRDLIATTPLAPELRRQIISSLISFVTMASSEMAYLSIDGKFDTVHIIDSCLDLLSNDPLLSSLIHIPALRQVI